MKIKSNTKLSILEGLICRSPQFSIDTSLEHAWPTLKRLIGESAVDFYPYISNLHYHDLDSQSEKIRYTVWKYFNRSRYRATPFGEFAAVSVVPFQTDAHTIQLEQKMDVLSWPDWKAVQDIHYPSEALSKANFRTNPLCYAYGEEFHYLYRGEKSFELNAIEKRQDINLILGYCKSLRDFDSIANMMLAELAMKKRGVLALIRRLLQLQVLECDLQANVTGEDYFQRKSLGDKEEHASNCYSIASRKYMSGGLDKRFENELKAYADFISRCMHTPVSTQLEQFKKAFLLLWEQRSVPLSLALDPILGIGYGNGVELQQESLVGELQQQRQHRIDSSTIGYNRFEQFILGQMLKGGQVQLADFQPDDLILLPPNTCSILFHIYKGNTVIHQAGGATATAMLGRFTPLEDIEHIARKLANIEQGANPNVVFFDLAYQFEGRTDNVNRRQQLYDTELPIGSWSTFDEPLRIEDIFISISNGQILLHHFNGTRLIPRLASAYNHSRSDLDLFRFLCDLQYQGIQSKISLDLQTIFPHLDHYPRVYFRNTIVCAAKWKLPHFSNTSDLWRWLIQKNLMQPFTVGQGDQTLVIDPKIPEELQYLLLYQKQKQHTENLYLTEALIDTDVQVNDADGKRYHAQFLAAITHQHEVYPMLGRKDPVELRRDLRMPGSEWFYIELYMRPELIEDFMLNEVTTLLNQHKSMIREWFFIRYNQPEPHLRLRLKIDDPMQWPSILLSIRKLMDISGHYGYLKRIEIKAYEREIMRYGQQQMAMVEYFFYLDSVWALKQFSLTTTERCSQIVTFAQRLCESLFAEPNDQITFFLRLAENFANEMSFNKNDFKKINQTYQRQRICEKTNEKLINYFRKLILNYEMNKRGTLLADLIHMHINRRFSGAQRMYEAVIYQFLYKRLVTRRHQKKEHKSNLHPAT